MARIATEALSWLEKQSGQGYLVGIGDDILEALARRASDVPWSEDVKVSNGRGKCASRNGRSL